MEGRYKIKVNGLLDFHTHSTHSDGGDTPTELVRRAKKHGVGALALTDHNVISGLGEFNRACKDENIIAIPFGTEIHAELPKEVLTVDDHAAPDMILLGKNAKPEHLNAYHQILKEYRFKTFYPKTIEGLETTGFYFPKVSLKQLAEDLGVPSVLHDFILERNNLDILVKYVQGWDSLITEEQIKQNPIRFVNRYLYAIGKPAYVKRLEGFGVKEAISLAESMDCRLFIAHPGGEFGSLSDSALNYLIEQRVHGIEIRSYFNSPEQNQRFDELAEKHRLLKSGGSDCHGNKGPFKVGCYDRPQNQLPRELFEQLWSNLP